MADQSLSIAIKRSLKFQTSNWVAYRAYEDMRTFLQHEIELGRITHLDHCVKVERVYDLLTLKLPSLEGDESALVRALGKVNNGRYISSLVRLGMDVHHVSSNGQTCVHYAINNDVSSSVLHHLLTSLSQRLPKYEFTELLNHRDSAGYTAMYYAMSKSRKVKYCKQFIHAGVLLDRADKDGQTMIHYAVANEHDHQIVEMIVQAGCNLNAIDESGRSALFASQSLSTFRSLLAYGIDTGLRDAKGYSILEHIMEKCQQGILSRMLAMKLVKMLDSFNAIHDITSPVLIYCDECIRAKLLWIKLRRIVRGKMFHFLESTSRANLFECARECDILSTMKDPPTERSLRNALRRFTFCEFDTSEAINEYTLLQSPVSDIPAEFSYTITSGSTLFAFDVRELVRLTENPYTKERFNEEQKDAFSSRLKKITYLRETVAVNVIGDLLNTSDNVVNSTAHKMDKLHAILPSLPCDFNDASKFTVFRTTAIVALLQEAIHNWEDFTLLQQYMEEDPQMETEVSRQAYIIDMLYEIIDEQPDASMSVNVAIDDVITLEGRIALVADMGCRNEQNIRQLTQMQEANILRCAYKVYVTKGYLFNISERSFKHTISNALIAHGENGVYADKSTFCAAIIDILSKATPSDQLELCDLLFKNAPSAVLDSM